MWLNAEDATRSITYPWHENSCSVQKTYCHIRAKFAPTKIHEIDEQFRFVLSRTFYQFS